jgi:hypothetical protein
MKKASLTFALGFFMLVAFGQEEKISLDISMTYMRMADGTVTLTAEVYDEEEYEAVTDLEFQFYSMGDEDVLLGSAFSNEDAMVTLSGIPFDNILRDPGDNMTFRLVGENEEIFGSSDLTIRHVDLKVNYDMVDSVKVVSVQLTGKDEEGNTVGVPDGEVYFYVPRLFGQLSIGDVWTDDDGYDKMNFPTDIPGDEEGYLTVIAKITESDEFGSLEVVSKVPWGVPSFAKSLKDRELWSPNTPMWMVITFAILITGVFVHYGWVLVNLYRLSKLGKDETIS